MTPRRLLTVAVALALGGAAAVAAASGLLPAPRLSALHVVLLPVLAAVLALAAAGFIRHGRIAPQLRARRAGLAGFRPARRGLPGAGLQLAAWALQGLAAYVLLLALHLDVPALLIEGTGAGALRLGSPPRGRTVP